jgi:NTE family protein
MTGPKIIRQFVQRMLVPFHWLFIRLPKPFSLPLMIVAIVYFFLVFPALVNVLIPRLIAAPLQLALGLSTELFWEHGIRFKLVSVVLYIIFLDLILIGSALMTLLFAAGGLLISHLIAGRFYMVYRRLILKPFPSSLPVLPVANIENAHEINSSHNPLARYKRIGIILSGGGAKGAYQAGAMKAIYEFLEKYNAHDNVQMIAATSIGSWNALFWLAGLIKSENGNVGPLEQWWTKVSVQNIILPINYLPTQQNYLLSNKPWRDTFDSIFKGTEAGKRLLYHVHQPDAADAVRFYFTHSNIGKAYLAFSTNREDWESVTPNLRGQARPVVLPGSYFKVRDPDDGATLKKIRMGVFSSMDIPPLFEYTSIQDDFYEDGGVIDNLPIRFGTEVEECDLLFILPLNASFERTVDHRSLIRRLARVTEIRQGVLERNSFKMIYLYNELASLRQRVNDLENKHSGQETVNGANEGGPDIKIADRALQRQHHVVHVFSICPAPELKIGTTEFWKTKEAGEAFRFMYEVTKNELLQFDQIVKSNEIMMALVSPSENEVRAERDGDSIQDTDLNGDCCFASAPINKSTGKVDYNVTYFRDF